VAVRPQVWFDPATSVVNALLPVTATGALVGQYVVPSPN
jgi:hypothetical protein